MDPAYIITLEMGKKNKFGIFYLSMDLILSTLNKEKKKVMSVFGGTWFESYGLCDLA